MPATRTININDHKDDPYLSEWYGVYALGETTPLERANYALSQADLDAMIASERGDDLTRAQVKAICERVALAASACAKATRQGRDEMAKRFSEKAESEALVLSTFDYSTAA